MENKNNTVAYLPEMTAQEQKKFKYWERRTMLACIVGYAMFYFVRKNISIAMPYMNEELGISKTDLGLFLTLHGLIYGLSKFINGMWGDRSNARYFLVSGLLMCAVANLFFGLSSSILVLGIFWVINGWFQGMGVPPCTRLMTHWITPEKLATKMSLWNTSHSIGAGLAIISCGYIVSINWGNYFAETSILSQHWRWCFLIPALLVVIVGIFVFFLVRDTPSSVGLPELKGEKSKSQSKKEESAEFKAFVKKHVFMNPTIWIIAVGNFFLYITRFAILDWGPTMLKEHLHLDISQAGWSVAAFEIAGIAGMLAAGWSTDKFFGGRAPRTCVICMSMSTLCLISLSMLNEHSSLILANLILISAGFFIYGPQALVGIAAANIATKRAAATAGGFCGLFGYGSTIVSGWGIGLLVEKTDWSIAIYALIGVAIMSALIFALAWKSKANGYED
ncbi:MFS transporter [uncultured Dysgonomonas sp.]|uniref:Sugar phosphate permease n=1 Tax=uncultured Dysgonomonas sp. TaxID=206096 RepID=A0A212ITX6_9BACT|nr:MFS transporter [uncultured Dysgonomonas sp.]SBV90654.1 Sugar phosphate permease [uncultured Dysgonomonas sp.]